MKKWLENANQKLKNFWWRWIIFTGILATFVAIIPLLVSGSWHLDGVTVADALEMLFGIAIAAIIPALPR